MRESSPPMFGILPVHKPVKVNSRRAVDIVESAVGEKVGHAGTLDPLASGILLIAIGPATRLVPYLQKMPKRYWARFTLGIASDSIDTERECYPVELPEIPTEPQLAAAANEFVGDLEQTPPPFSAVKVGGRRAYRLAQRGRTFEIAPKRIHIGSIHLSAYAFPHFEIDVRCGRGTYIRSLGRDIARRVGTECVMTDLCRTELGPFRLEDCVSLDEVRAGNFSHKLVDPLIAVEHLPRVILQGAEVQRLARGGKFEFAGPVEGSEIAVVDEQQRLQAIMRPAPDGQWRPALNFSVALARGA